MQGIASCGHSVVRLSWQGRIINESSWDLPGVSEWSFACSGLWRWRVGCRVYTLSHHMTSHCIGIWSVNITSTIPPRHTTIQYCKPSLQITSHQAQLSLPSLQS